MSSVDYRSSTGSIDSSGTRFTGNILQFTFVILIASIFQTTALAEISEQGGTVTEGWDGPGLGSATIDWYLGWPSTNCETSGGDGYTNDLTTAQVEAEILAAMATWSAVVDVTWNKVGDALNGCFQDPAADTFDCDGDPDTFQTNIIWNRLDHCDVAPFDGPWNPSQSGQNNDGHVFAHAFGPPDIWLGFVTNNAFIGNVHLDDDENWVTTGASSLGPGTNATVAFVDVRSEVLHELGHVLGLAHTNSSNAVMNPLKWVLERRNLTAFDITEIQSLYAANETESDVVLLLDTSGSMGWSVDGNQGVPVELQRLTHARNAVLPFLDLLELNADSGTDFGVARFPLQPFSSGNCSGETVQALVNVGDNNIGQAKDLVNGLQAQGSTPLIAGLQSARNMFEPGNHRAVILLSDGYHNCPQTIDAYDPEVTGLIQQLNDADIRVYTIGFGRPSDIDYPLLERLAADTAGAFFDVTEVPGLDTGDWAPATALQETYKNILSDALNLQIAEDPLARLQAGESITEEIPVTTHDRSLNFYVSWITPDPDRLTVELRASDNSIITPTSGVRIRNGNTYKIIHIDATFLALPGKTGSQPWKLVITPNSFKDHESEALQYSVLLDSDLKLTPGIRSKGFATGNELLLTASVTAAGQSITGLEEITVMVDSPEESYGNWHAKHPVAADKLEHIKVQDDTGPVSALQRKMIHLTEQQQVELPGRVRSEKLNLYDDGTHGDVRAGDGIYSTLFQDTVKSGSYGFLFTAEGKNGNASFYREARLRYVIKPVFDALNTLVMVQAGKAAGSIAGYKPYTVTVTPKDKYGNYFGPGFKDIITASGQGLLINEVIDNLDGSYTVQLEAPAKQLDKARLPIDIYFGETHKPAELPGTGPGKAFYQWLCLLLLLAGLWLLYVCRRRSVSR